MPVGKTYLNVSLFGRHTDGAINQVRYPVDSLAGTLLSTYANIGRERAVGLNLFANAYLTDAWTLNGGIDVDYASLEGQVTGADGASVTATNSGFNYGGRVQSEYDFGGGWSAQAFGFMRGRRVELQGFRGGFGLYALGVSREFADGRGTVGLAAENFLGRGWTIYSELDAADFTQVRGDVLLNRSVKLTFSYKLGQLEAGKRRRKTRSVRNDDLLEGGGDGGQGGS